MRGVGADIPKLSTQADDEELGEGNILERVEQTVRRLDRKLGELNGDLEEKGVSRTLRDINQALDQYY